MTGRHNRGANRVRADRPPKRSRNNGRGQSIENSGKFVCDEDGAGLVPTVMHHARQAQAPELTVTQPGGWAQIRVRFTEAESPKDCQGRFDVIPELVDDDPGAPRDLCDISERVLRRMVAQFS